MLKDVKRKIVFLYLICYNSKVTKRSKNLKERISRYGL